MKNKRKTLSAPVTMAGILLIVLILVFGTIWMGNAAQKDTNDAVHSVSSLYLDELAGRREQVVADNLKDNIDIINVMIGMLEEEDLRDAEHLQSYQKQMKALFNLERFAFVDSEGQVYTSEGIQSDIDEYSFDYRSLSGPEISIKNVRTPDKTVVIALPVSNLSVGDTPLVACFTEQSMDVMLHGVSMTSQETDVTFSNIYTHEGVALSDTILGGLAAEDNLLDALAIAEYDPGYSFEKVLEDFNSGNRGAATFTYNGIRETLSYVPVDGTDWFLTYLVREGAISESISSISKGIISRSVIQSILTVIVLGLLFLYIIVQTRRNAKLTLEKETAETESRIKQEEMEHRLALQEELLKQKAQQEQLEKMITALSSDYRSVYYLELDIDHGVCYQARTDLPGFKFGEEFNYLEAVTAYCNQYILEEYREDFLKFIQPDNIMEGLEHSRIISHTYMISVDGKESYETVKFAGVGHTAETEGHLGHNVGACFVDVDQDTRKALAQQKELSDALKAAEEASKAKTAFLSNMSHEIRTPMNAIIGLNNIALNEPDVSDRMHDYLTKIKSSAQHLLGIINDILDMSRIESGKMVIKNEEFSFSKSLEQVNNIISGQCRDKGLTYECHTEGKIDNCYVGDGVKLKQIMLNILGNAVKFTPSGGSVTFTIKEGQRFDNKAVLEMTIRDTGIGMSEEYLPKIFDALSQEDSSTTNKYGSTGLGMPITKSIVELMNGHIEVSSKKGEGTTFVVAVTLGEADHPSSDLQEGELDPSKVSVLVIDDDPIALEHASIVLGQVGVNCEKANSGKEALEMVRIRHGRREDYDLILVDWKMPEMDGIETTRKIRAVVGNETPIIILTSYNWDDVEAEALNAGVDTFVPKPLFASDVMDEFNDAFKKKASCQEEHRADLKGRRILLAEDVQVNAEIMVMLLSMREIETDVAENGRIAVDKYTGHPAGYYDAILMDMRMPEMDGLEATRAIRTSGREDADSIPIIALTANAFDEDVQRSMQAGLNAHLSKPVETDALFDTLETLIKD